jgi:hypothetical protein
MPNRLKNGHKCKKKKVSIACVVVENKLARIQLLPDVLLIGHFAQLP